MLREKEGGGKEGERKGGREGRESKLDLSVLLFIQYHCPIIFIGIFLKFLS